MYVVEEEVSETAEDEADANEVLLEDKKTVFKMQINKLCTRLLRLMSHEPDWPLSKTWRRKSWIKILEDLIVIYEGTNDKRNVKLSTDEIDKIIDRQET